MSLRNKSFLFLSLAVIAIVVIIIIILALALYVRRRHRCGRYGVEHHLPNKPLEEFSSNTSDEHPAQVRPNVNNLFVDDVYT